jgi:hypothetical protein
MKLKTVLNELQAEIINGKIPAHKIFSNNNVINLKNYPEWRGVLEDILRAIKENGLQDKFSKDLSPDDITGDKASGTVRLTADSGEKYIYNVNRKKLEKAYQE